MKTPEDWKRAPKDTATLAEYRPHIQKALQELRTIQKHGSYKEVSVRELRFARIPTFLAEHTFLVGLPQDLDAARIRPSLNDEGHVEIARVNSKGNIIELSEALFGMFGLRGVLEYDAASVKSRNSCSYGSVADVPYSSIGREYMSIILFGVYAFARHGSSYGLSGLNYFTPSQKG